MTQAAALPPLGFGPDDEIDPAEAKRNADRLAELLRAVRRAEKCFQIARSTPYRGEREAAISRGIAIAEKAGLVLALFDIPGHDEYLLRTALSDIEETLQRLGDKLRAGASETVYDAKRRAFHAATMAAAERDRANGRRAAPPTDMASIRRAELLDRWPSTGSAINALRARRVAVHAATAAAADPDHPGEERWYAPSRGLDTFDEWQLRELADEVCA